MMISFIISLSPLTGVVLLFIFIIAGIKHAFKNMAKEAEAYNKKHGKQEGEKCETEMADRELIDIPNSWSEGGVHLAIASYDRKTRLYHAKVINGRTYNSVYLVGRSKKEIEEKIDETFKQYDSKKKKKEKV